MATDHPIVAGGEGKAEAERAGGRPCLEGVPRPPEPRGSLIYFVQAAPGWPIKIGITIDMRKRLSTLRGESGLYLRVLAVMDGDVKLETRLHRRFRDHRIVGEWFRPTVGLVNLIAERGRSWQEAPPKRTRHRAFYLPPLEALESFPKRPERRIGKARVSRVEGVHLRDLTIRQMSEKGCPVCEIAEGVGKSEKTVYRRMAILGIEPPRRAQS